MALSSLVATTATVLAMLFGPIVSSRNSRTSRPRSPTSATTTVSKASARGEHGEQRRLADARAGEDAEPLAEAERREDVDDPDAGHERRADALARQRRGRRAGRGLGGSPSTSGGPPSIGAGERVDGAAAPRGVRRDVERAAVEDGVADAGIGAALERRDQHLVGRDLHDLAAARAGAAAVLDDVAQPGDRRQAAHAVMGRRDFGDAAAAPQQRALVGETAPDALQRRRAGRRRRVGQLRGRVAEQGRVGMAATCGRAS